MIFTIDIPNFAIFKKFKKFLFLLNFSLKKKLFCRPSDRRDSLEGILIDANLLSIWKERPYEGTISPCEGSEGNTGGILKIKIGGKLKFCPFALKIGS